MDITRKGWISRDGDGMMWKIFCELVSEHMNLWGLQAARDYALKKHLGATR